ncbi:MAG: chromosome segregation protein SMC [Ekhidna sp.]|nr:chromosome segregation protein SMC [Ekhidna sp.]MBC6410024.1 chromosome segregation protein SMC [Ekhidna sp.]MBC6427193.1 chromosome segregation protein SMC [Ekhidna sp.]
MNENQKEYITPKKNKTSVFIIVISLLLIAVFFFYYQNRQLEAEKERQQKEISRTYLKLDSVSNELDIRIKEITALGGRADTLEYLKAQLETDKKQLLLDAEYQRAVITKLNSRVDGYKELLLIKDEEIEQLKVFNNRLTKENTSLKVEKNRLNESIQQLKENTQELEQKVAQASRLEIQGMKIIAVSKRGKERDNQEYRNRHIDQLKIQFTVLENEIAPIEGKGLLLRVVAPDGNVLFDVTRGSGSFSFENRELFYTAKQEILYDRNSQLVTFLYNKGSEYAIGQHMVEVYTDDYLIGRGTFTIK